LEEGFRVYHPNSQVGVTVKTSRRNKVSIFGDVSNPGFYAAGNKMQIKDALALAGSLIEEVEPRSVALIRGGLDSPQIFLLDVAEQTDEKIIEQNFLTEDGDLIYVSKSTISSIDIFSACLETLMGPIVKIEEGISIEPAGEDKEAHSIIMVP
jgi:protein involved in polysaccharide export with SLBB domain